MTGDKYEDSITHQRVTSKTQNSHGEDVNDAATAEGRLTFSEPRVLAVAPSGEPTRFRAKLASLHASRILRSKWPQARRQSQ